MEHCALRLPSFPGCTFTVRSRATPVYFSPHKGKDVKFQFLQTDQLRALRLVKICVLELQILSGSFITDSNRMGLGSVTMCGHYCSSRFWLSYPLTNIVLQGEKGRKIGQVLPLISYLPFFYIHNLDEKSQHGKNKLIEFCISVQMIIPSNDAG